MKKINYLLACLIFLGFLSCKREDPTLGDPPTEADAQFSVTPTAANPNIVDFKASNQDLTAIWDLGNGATASGPNVTGIYPNAGTYTVTLTVFNRGGSKSSSQDVVIANTDPSLLDNPIFNALTGGASGPGSKTWVIDSVSPAHFGVGPDPIGSAGDFPEYYAAGPLDKAGVGLYDDRYVFHLEGFRFDMVTQGQAYVHNELAGDFPGSYENAVDYTAPYADRLNETWSYTDGSPATLTISGDAFIGMYTGYRVYNVLTVNDTALWLQYQHHAGGLFWYLRLIPEGFVSNQGGGGTTGYALPLDFESVEPEFTTFGNSSYAFITNPDQSGINTSSKVLETVHGNETWAGLFVDLADPLDFSTQSSITLKVWAPITGDFRFKIENSSNTNDFVEVDATVTTANTWEQISVDFTGAAAGAYDRLVLFPGWDVANAGTFYIDDIEQQ